MPIMYVAGPLLQGQTLSFEEGKKNWEKTVELSHKLMQKGWTVHIPHHSLFMWQHMKDKFDIDIPWNEWMIQDSGMIKVSHAVFFIGHSKGADRELEWATDNAMPIYTEVSKVPKVIPEDCLMRKDTISPEPYKVPQEESNIQD